MDIKVNFMDSSEVSEYFKHTRLFLKVQSFDNPDGVRSQLIRIIDTLLYFDILSYLLTDTPTTLFEVAAFRYLISIFVLVA